MKSYLVTWEMEFDAESPEEAARQALAVHRNPESIATVFQVLEIDNGEGQFSVFNEPVTVDLLEVDAVKEEEGR